jgi:hypothetical protein
MDGNLTSKNVLAPIEVVEKLEVDRDESTEWKCIKELQRERVSP